MANQDFDKLYERFIFYNNVHYNADVTKIANLANEEKLKSLLEVVIEGGILYLKRKIEEIKDSKVISSILIVLGPFDQQYAISKYQELIATGDSFILIQEPYGLMNMKDINFHEKNMQYFRKLVPKLT